MGRNQRIPLSFSYRVWQDGSSGQNVIRRKKMQRICIPNAYFTKLESDVAYLYLNDVLRIITALQINEILKLCVFEDEYFADNFFLILYLWYIYVMKKTPSNKILTVYWYLTFTPLRNKHWQMQILFLAVQLHLYVNVNIITIDWFRTSGVLSSNNNIQLLWFCRQQNLCFISSQIVQQISHSNIGTNINNEMGFHIMM